MSDPRVLVKGKTINPNHVLTLVLLTEIEGIRARLETNDALFEKYLVDSYGPAIRSVEEIGDPADFDVTVSVRFEKAHNAESGKWLDSAVDSNPIIIGSFLREGTRSVLYQYAPLNVVAEWSGDRLRIDTLFEMTRKFRALKRFRHYGIFTDYQIIMRRSVHFPYFLLLCQKGYSLLHASMSYRGEDAVLFMGLNGAGKTTAALSLLPEMSIAADNFVFFDGERAFGYPELLRIPGDIPANPGSKDRAPIVDGKTQVKMIEGRKTAHVRPRACVIVKRGRENSWEEIPRDQAIEYLETTDLFQHETHEFSYLAFIRNRPSPKMYPKCKFYSATVCGKEESRAMIRNKVGELFGL
jgi:hypothetical protein